MSPVTMLNPEALGKPLGQYSQIARVKAGELAFIAGQVAADKEGRVVGADDFDAQCRQVFNNVNTALQAVGAGWGDVVQFTTYVVDADDIAKFMQFRLREFPKMFPGGAYPPNTLLIIDRLVQAAFLIEVQTVAAVAPH
jgi:enamine deaminase RidA (YjgF/YER057c/UK114 family)